MGVNFPEVLGPRAFVGRIESVDRHSGKERSRFTFIIDAVEDAFDPNRANEPVAKWEDKHFALIRVMTTYKKFAHLGSDLINPHVSDPFR